MSTKTATYVRDVHPDANGDMRLYRLDPPALWMDGWGDSATERPAEYVIVSAATVMNSGPETYIFPSNHRGEIVNWGELDGSFQGALDHEAALNNAGYEVAS